MEVIKDAVSISEMARTLGLSRARFYQLMRAGVFPEPTRPGKGKRPFFTREQQEQCIEVRRKNRGVNGQTVLFYAMRSPSVASRPPRRRASSRRATPNMTTGNPMIAEIQHGLTQLGLVDVTDRSISSALADLYPDGYAETGLTELLRTVFAHLNRQDSTDNVAR